MISIERLWSQGGGLCWYCEKLTWVKRSGYSIRVIREELFDPLISKTKLATIVEKRRATREHLKRVADGGKGNRMNIVLACAGCNASRGTRTPEEHLQIIRSERISA